MNQNGKSSAEEIGARIVWAPLPNTGPVHDTSRINASGVFWQITSRITGNLYAQYTLPMAGEKGNYRMRLGVRNMANTAPPLPSLGYSGAMYNPYGRYLYANFKVDFQVRYQRRDGICGHPANPHDV